MDTPTQPDQPDQDGLIKPSAGPDSEQLGPDARRRVAESGTDYGDSDFGDSDFDRVLDMVKSGDLEDARRYVAALPQDVRARFVEALSEEAAFMSGVGDLSGAMRVRTLAWETSPPEDAADPNHGLAGPIAREGPPAPDMVGLRAPAQQGDVARVWGVLRGISDPVERARAAVDATIGFAEGDDIDNALEACEVYVDARTEDPLQLLEETDPPQWTDDHWELVGASLPEGVEWDPVTELWRAEDPGTALGDLLNAIDRMPAEHQPALRARALVTSALDCRRRDDWYGYLDAMRVWRGLVRQPLFVQAGLDRGGREPT